ncbi:MAG: hypothetical protein IPP33_05305 [Flavobacteriales bacterium]|nr:hypothetical protein [Flavobacteriales bacterium]
MERKLERLEHQQDPAIANGEMLQYGDESVVFERRWLLEEPPTALPSGVEDG